MNENVNLGGGNIDDHNDPKRSTTSSIADESKNGKQNQSKGHRARRGNSLSLPAKNGLGADELNFAEFPLAVFSKRLAQGQKTVEFEDEVFDEGGKQNVRRRLVISGSDRFGLPTPADTDVLLILIQLTKQRSNFKERLLSFSRYELVELLRWNHGGASYKRLEESLQRWTSTTLYYHHAWWDRTVRRWKSSTFHVIETLDLKGRDEEGPDDSLCALAWNEVLFQSFQASNLKALDLDTYFQLKRPAARQAYRFLDKRFYHGPRLEFDLRVFACEHVGLSRDHDSAQLRRALDPVLKELEDIGFLQPTATEKRHVRHGPGHHRVVLVRNRSRTPATTEGGESLLAQELTKRGVWADMSPTLAKALPEEEVRRYLALHDWLVGRRDKRIAKNPAGFLAACIAQRFPLPKDFERSEGQTTVSSPTANARQSVAASNAPINAEVIDAEQIAIEKKLARLSEAERSALEAEAFGQAKPLVAATYERLQKDGGTLFAEVRHSLLVGHLKSKERERHAVPTELAIQRAG